MPRNLINKPLSTIPATSWDGKSTPRIVAVHMENSDPAGILLPSPGSHFKRDLTGRERRQMGNRTGAGCSSLSSYPHPCQSRWRRLCSSRLRAAGAPRRSAWGRDAAGGTSLQVDASPGRPGTEGGRGPFAGVLGVHDVARWDPCTDCRPVWELATWSGGGVVIRGSGLEKLHVC